MYPILISLIFASVLIQCSEPILSNDLQNQSTTPQERILRSLDSIKQKMSTQQANTTTISIESKTSATTSSQDDAPESKSCISHIEDENSNPSVMLTRILPAGLAATSIATALFLNRPETVQRRSLLSAGDAFGAAGVAKSLSIITAVAAGSYWIHRALSGLHSGCKADQERLEQTFERKQAEAKQDWKNSLVQALQNHMVEVGKRDTELVNKLNIALNAQKEETHELISPIIEALEHSVQAFAGNAPDMERVQKEMKETIEKAKKELSALQQSTGTSITISQPIPGVTFVQPKEKTTSCGCCLPCSCGH